MRCDLDHAPRGIFAGINSWGGNLSDYTIQTHPKIIYLVVLTIARRCAPFANFSETLVVLELIGENFTILPVIPVLLVVNKSPIWYVYPPSVIFSCLSFVVVAYLLSLTFFRGEVKYPSPPNYLIKDNEQ